MGRVMFTKAIVRKPGANFADGLTSVDFGVPDYAKALTQWEAYCAALESCGLALTVLEEDLAHPDSTFVEDAAVLTEHGAMLTRPGAASRSGEVEAIAPTVRLFYSNAVAIAAPGTLDGGDICEAVNDIGGDTGGDAGKDTGKDAGGHFFLGISKRTNEEGARQLAEHLAKEGFTCSTVDVRAMTTILHLKSGISYIGDNVLVVMEEMADRPEFAGYDLLRVPEEESYGANCVRVNDRVLVADGYPWLTGELRRRGFDPLILDMSEFRKMDGGLSCLSLRF
jgi:dimethylargininase